MDGHSANFNIKYKYQTEVTEPKNEEAQQQNRWGSRMNRETGRQNNGTHPDRVTEWKKEL